MYPDRAMITVLLCFMFDLFRLNGLFSLTDATELVAQSDNRGSSLARSTLHLSLSLVPRAAHVCIAMSSNLVVVTSPEHFQQVLSVDLERVSITNFWAPWAEPCKAMNDAVAELAKNHSKILFLNVCVAPRALFHLNDVC